MKIKKNHKVILLILPLILQACPATPKMTNVETGNERSLDCNQLSYEIKAAEQAKIDAHAQDKFRAADIFPPTGVISVYRIWRAGDSAIARIELLNKIYTEKNCQAPANVPYSSNEGYMVLAQYLPHENPAINEQSKDPQSFASVGDSVDTQEDQGQLMQEPSSSDFIKDDYDPVVYPHKDPGHFTF